MYLDDQLELVVMGYCNYAQYGEDMAGYLYYDVYELIGGVIEAMYSGYPEFTPEMGASEANKIVSSIVNKLVTASEVLKDQLDDIIIPLLSADEDAIIGGVVLVGGDMAVRIDNVSYEYRTPDVGGGDA